MLLRHRLVRLVVYLFGAQSKPNKPAAAKLTPLGFARFAAHGFSPFLFQGSKTTARLMAKTRQHLKPLLRFLKSSVLAIKLLLLELLDTP